MKFIRFSPTTDIHFDPALRSHAKGRIDAAAGTVWEDIPPCIYHFPHSPQAACNMINLGYGSSIVVNRISPETVCIHIRIEGAANTDALGKQTQPHPYFGASDVTVKVLLTGAQYDEFAEHVLALRHSKAPLTPPHINTRYRLVLWWRRVIQRLR